MSRLEELSDYDFERLVADLLSREWRATVEDFPRGRDGGVDLRVLGPTGPPLNLGAHEELVVQCKHQPRATFAQLRRELATEATKPVISAVARYAVATSARLTRANKREVVSIFSRRVLEQDILGENDIARLLRLHPEVERAHPKLWLSSAAVASGLIDRIESLHSASLVGELKRLRQTFVETPILGEALGRLETAGICMIVGPPGVGKTATGYMLLLRLMAQGWQPIVGSSQVRQLEVQLIDDVKQVLLFDDFLGQNPIDRLSGGQDSDLLRLLRMVERDRSKLLILTTREFVFQQARQRSEKLGDELFDVVRVTIQMPAISWQVRAHILYNQLYYSPIRGIAAAAPSASDVYLKISRHKKFNPRVTQAAISAIARELGLLERKLDLGSSTGERPPLADATERPIDVPARLEAALDSPKALWENILSHQLTPLQRSLLLLRVSFGSQPLFLDDLYSSARKYIALTSKNVTLHDLDLSLAVLDGDFLTIQNTDGDRSHATLDSLNPGLSDALIAHMRKYQDELQRVVQSIVSFAQVTWIAQLCELTPTRHATWIEKPFWEELVRAGEECLDAQSSRVVFSIVPPHPSRARTFSGFGDRLEFLALLYRKSNIRSNRQLAERVVPKLLAQLNRLELDQFRPLAAALNLAEYRPWAGYRTDVRVALLDQLEYPRDVEDWTTLRLVMEEIETTTEYDQDAERRVQDFLDDQRDQLLELLEDEDSDLEGDLEELQELASLWRAYFDDTDIADEVDRRAGSRAINRHGVETRLPFDYGPTNDHPGPDPVASLFDNL